MTAPAKNYTTSIPVSRTLGEVMHLLAEAGADQIVTRYGPDRQPAGIAFTVTTAAGPAGYRLDIDARAVQARMEAWYYDGHTKAGKPTRDQAARAAWRTLEEWIAAQLEMIRNGLVQLDEILLPYRVIDAKGTTVYQALQSGQLALPGGAGRAVR